jgi:tRNA (guanine26-N2/guanine27-N2)-dimethyltransferase
MTVNNYQPGFPVEIVQEGKVKVLVPRLRDFVRRPCDYAPSKAPVFYNPVMELNRDIAVLVVQSYQRLADHNITISEPLTGSGLRGIRFAAEVVGVESTIIGDINENAFKLANHNVQINGLADSVAVERQEANLALAIHSAPRTRFDVIDIDPFGSPVPFLDSAIRALKNHGLLAVTATDMASLCGVHPKTCLRKYGGKSLRTEYCHELAVRLLSGRLATVAAKYDIGVKVVFSHRGEHYIRVYATIDYEARSADLSLEDMGFVFHCFNCFHRETVRGPILSKHSPRTCVECGSTLSVAGPLWLGKISDRDFDGLIEVELEKRKLKSDQRIANMLTLIKNESDSNVGYYVIDEMCDMLGLPVPSVEKVVEALEKQGFGSDLTHFNPRGIRAKAPAHVLANILKGLAGSIRGH